MLKTISTVKKGDKLEKEVHEIFLRLLSDGSYYLNSKSSKVFYKKGYFSKDRDSEIIFDVSIETYMDGAEDYSLLTLIECKNLNKKVSVDDIEEFDSKISQIGIHNTKGIVITSIGFQESAFNVGRSKRIGLAKIKDTNKLEWLSHRKDKKKNVGENEFFTESSSDHTFISNIEGKSFDNIPDLLLHLSIIDRFVDKEDLIFVPFIPVHKIDSIVDKLSGYDLYDNNILNLDRLTELMHDRYGVEFEFDTQETTPYLGKIEFNPLKIKISKSARINDHLWRFTLAHEIGHLILHSKIINERIDAKIDSENTFNFKYFNPSKNISRMEFQANLFTSALFLPDKLLMPKVSELFVKYRINRGRMYLDNQPINRHEVYAILYNLSSSFQVSIEAIKIRLIKLNLLIDDTDKSFGTLLRKYFKM